MRYDRTYWTTVGIALLPALGASVVVVVLGRAFNVADTVVERVSQLLFFPIFLGMCYYLRSRRPRSAA
jgi:hypothetical protein